MTTYQVHCNVLSGNTEYFKFLESVGSGDVVDFYFNREVIVDDIVLNASTTFTGSISIVYPASDTSLEITDEPSDAYFLNKIGSTTKLWYRIPAGAKVRFTFSTADLTNVTCCLIGRGV